jgi:hypothetical protein
MMNDVSQDLLRPGDRLRLFGGYDPMPEWLTGRDALDGTIVRFIPGQEASRAAAVVRLDEEVTVGEVAGSIVVLELRYADAMWTPEGIAHVELCDFEPEPTASGDRRRGRWVESHASYRRLGQST